jgi:hypothetical protein
MSAVNERSVEGNEGGQVPRRHWRERADEAARGRDHRDPG